MRSIFGKMSILNYYIYSITLLIERLKVVEEKTVMSCHVMSYFTSVLTSEVSSASSSSGKACT